jgi:hypothetical protein
LPVTIRSMVLSITSIVLRQRVDSFVCKQPRSIVFSGMASPTTMGMASIAVSVTSSVNSKSADNSARDGFLDVKVIANFLM